MLFQTNVFHESDDDSIKCILNHFKKIELVDADDVTFNVPSIKVDKFRGSINLGLKLKRMESFTDALEWAPFFRWKMVNPYFHFNDLENILDMNIDWPKFVRPVKGNKTFSGNVYSKQKLQAEWDFLKQKNVSNPMCMVSEVSGIRKEFRCIFIGGDYMSGSQYMKDSELYVNSFVPDNIIKFATEISYSDYFTNKFNYVIDVGIKDNNSIVLIEINQLETSSFYGADLDKIYHALKNEK